MSDMHAGLLNRYGELQEDISTANDSLGTVIEDWRTIARVWFQKLSTLGGETFQDSQTQAWTTHTITMRYRARTHARMRIVESGKVYDFAEPPRDEDGDRQWLTVQATEADLPREE